MGQELQVLLTAKDGISRTLNQVGQQAQQLSGQLTQGLGGAMRSLGSLASAPTRALGGLVDVFGKIGLAVFGVKQTLEIFAGALQGLLGEALEAQKGQAQLNAVLASTGGAAGVTAAAANDLASSLQKVTTFSDDAVLEAENLLLTFTSIGKEVFPQATETVLNMATALGEDTKSAAIQLGKALQDPVKGITALRKVGVNFTDAQKDMIKGMVAAGDVAGAQTLILKELKTEFGNSARAAGETFAGKLEILSHQFDELKQTIGEAILPILSDLLDSLMPIISAVADALPAALDKAAAVLGQLGASFASVQQVLQPFADGLLEIGALLGGGDFLGAADKAGEMLQGLVDSISGWVSGNGLRDVADALVGLASSAWDWLTTAADRATEVLGGWIESVKKWATGDGLGELADALVGLAASGWSWIKVAVEQAGDYLGGLIDGVVAWVGGPGLDQMNNAFLGLSGAAWSWLGVAGAVVGGPLGILVGVVVDWVNEHGINDIGNALSGLASVAWDWVLKARDFAADNLNGLIDGVKAWVTKGGIANIATALAGLADSAWDWIVKAAASAEEKLGSITDAVGAWGSGVGQTQLANSLIGLANRAWDWVIRARDTAIEKLGGLVDGVKAWMDAGGPGLVAAALFELANAAWDWVQEATKTAAVKLGPIIQSVRDWVTKSAWSEVQAQGERLGQALFSGLVGGFTLAIDAGGLQPALDTLMAKLKGVQVPDNLLLGWRSLGDSFRIVSGWLGGGGQGGATVIGGLLGAKKGLDDFAGSIGFALIGGAAKQFKDMALAIEEVLSAINRLVRGRDTFKQVIEDMKTVLLHAFDSQLEVFTIGANVVQGIIDGITSKIDALGGVVKALANQIPQWLKDILQISSPSRVTYDIGIEIGQGLIAGMGAQAPGVAAATANLTGKMVSVLQNAQQQVHGILVKIRDDYNAIIEMGGGPPVAPRGPTGGPASGASASGAQHGGTGLGGRTSLPGTLPAPGPNPQTQPWTGKAAPPRPAGITGPLVMGPYGPYYDNTPRKADPWDPGGGGLGQQGAGNTVHFYGDNYFTGPSMVDALNELSQMVG